MGNSVAKLLTSYSYHQCLGFLHRCAFDSTVQFISVTQPHKMRFSFKSFKFFGYTQVYLHCQIFMCHKQSTDARCSSGCQGNNIKRFRRSVLLESDEMELRSLRRRESEPQGPNYRPSKTYSLSIGPFVEDKNKQSGESFNDTQKVGI